MSRLSLYGKILGLGFLAYAGIAAQAADQSSGCGMGWSVAPKNSLLSSSTRSLVNATFSNTIGMTSGTSGCSKHSIVQNEKKAIHFAEANQGQLVIEMAQGQGEHLRSLAAVMGCSPASAHRFGSATQRGYTKIFPANEVSASQMLEGVKSVIQTDPMLASQCGFSS